MKYLRETSGKLLQMKKCAFCPNDSVEHGGEHIWDDWLNRWFSVSGYNVKYTSMTEGRREYKSKEIDTKLPVVCPNCNSGWMSQVTERMKTNFRYPMRDGSSLCILPGGIELLAAFTFLKAVCTDHYVAETNEPFFTRAVRERFGKTLNVPPVGVRMWIGAFQGQCSHSTKSVINILSCDDPAIKGVEYLAYTYVVGHLVLQLCAARWKHVHKRGREIIPMLVPDAYWDDAAVRFWPPVGLSVEWPPPKHFGDDTIQEFVNRFKVPILTARRW